jgi:hypothetical protein
MFGDWQQSGFASCWIFALGGNAAAGPALRCGNQLLHRSRLMAENNGDLSLRDILLFVSGLGAGGFVTAILFAMAVSGGLLRFT